MKIVIIAAAVAFVAALLGTPLLIRLLVSRGFGQYIRDDGPTGHYVKRGTPTMGGIVIIVATILGYCVAHLVDMRVPSVSGLLLIGLMTGMGFVGFLDDFTKIHQQRSLGLTGWQKLLGQVVVATTFGVLSLYFTDSWGRTPATTSISVLRDTAWDLAVFGPVVGMILFVIWANLIVAGASNGVNLTDGLDGLATGASVMVFGAYVLICVWQLNQNCLRYGSGRAVYGDFAKCYDVRDPFDLTLVAACLAAACFGFLWWNASPAKIFMGDTGALALGGALGGLAILTHTELLTVLLGGLFVIITLSVIIQRVYFKFTRKRVFRMAPLQHHFELKGWNEVTIVIRFWIIAGMCAALAMGIFYGEWVVGT